MARIVELRRPRVDIFKAVKKPKAPQPRNRIFKSYRIKWAGGVITVRAMIDQYPAGNKVTYVLSVRKGGKVLKVVKDRKGNDVEIRSKVELIERNTYADCHSKTMMTRIDEFRAIPEANYE